MRVQVGHGRQQDGVVVVGRRQRGLRVCCLRLRLCHAGQVLYDCEAVRFERDICENLITTDGIGRVEDHTHLPNPRIQTRVSPVLQPVANPSVIGTCDGRARRSRRRAVPGAGIAVVDDRRASACAI